MLLVLEGLNGFIPPVTLTDKAISSGYTLYLSDYLLLGNTAGGTFYVELPAPTNGREYAIKDSTGNFEANPVFLQPHASEYIEGVTGNGRNTTNQWGSWTIVTDGTNWYLLNG